MENFDVELSDNKSKMTLLSPEIIEIRNKIVDKLEGKSLKDIRSNIKDFLDNEKKEETRLRLWLHALFCSEGLFQ